MYEDIVNSAEKLDSIFRMNFDKEAELQLPLEPDEIVEKLGLKGEGS